MLRSFSSLVPKVLKAEGVIAVTNAEVSVSALEPYFYMMYKVLSGKLSYMGI